MMIFTSIYSVVDGIFVANFVGKTPFAAINFVMPFMMGLSTIGFMIGTGGSAIVARLLGEKKAKDANRAFSLFVYVTLAAGFLLTVIGEIVARPVLTLMRADGALLDDCVLYVRINLLSLPFFMLQIACQSFFNAAEKPRMGLAVTICAGVSNMVLDALFILGFGWGLAGAAAATSVAETLGGVIPLVYFSRKNTSLLRLTKTKLDWKLLWAACWNGTSELMSSLSSSIVTLVFNLQLLRLLGENGVAAYGALMYVNFILAAMFIGYSLGSAALVSYNYGAGNTAELKNLFRKSLILIFSANAVVTAAAFLSAGLLGRVFSSGDAELALLMEHGMRIYAVAFLMIGFNIFGSSFFTALGNGQISALISFLRTLVFQVTFVMILPMIFGADGIWTAAVLAEFMALLVTVLFLQRKKTTYHYI